MYCSTSLSLQIFADTSYGADTMTSSFTYVQSTSLCLSFTLSRTLLFEILQCEKLFLDSQCCTLNVECTIGCVVWWLEYLPL